MVDPQQSGSDAEDPTPNLVLTVEQEEIAATLRRFLAGRWDIRRLLADEPLSTGEVQELWREVAAATGVAGVGVPDVCGGVGAGVTELAVVAEEFGRVVHPTPWLGTLGLAVPLLGTDPLHPRRAQLLEQIADQHVTVTVVRSPVGVTVREDQPGILTAHGRCTWVPDGGHTQWLLLVVDHDGQPTLFGVEVSEQQRSRLIGLDRGRVHADISLDGAVVLDLGPADPEYGRTCHIARIAVAAELLGVTGRCLEIAVDYAQQRKQFGRPIGSYQAVQHRCARMLLEVEQARSILRYAAWCADYRPEGLSLAAMEALLFCGTAATRVSADLIRVLGGTGFTWEHEAHLYFRRARASMALLDNDPMTLRNMLAERLLQA